jgi:polar amino acid transport system substrate-binding protein
LRLARIFCRVLFSILLVGMSPIILAQVTQFEPIVLGVPDFKPYSYTHEGVIKGSAISELTNFAHLVPMSYTLKQYSDYSLLLKALKKNEIQGFFLATQNAERDRYAEFSKPLTFNNWSWFVRKDLKQKVSDHSFVDSATIATIAKTNTFRWLTRNGYQVQTDTRLNLPYLLLNKQVDAVFLSETVFEGVCQELGINKSAFKKTIEKKRSFSTYISKQYLNDNLGFMEALNNAIPDIK